jgi:hypothetical protein
MERHGKATKTCTFGTKSHAQRINAVEWGRVGKHGKKSSIGGFLHMQHVNSISNGSAISSAVLSGHAHADWSTTCVAPLHAFRPIRRPQRSGAAKLVALAAWTWENGRMGMMTGWDKTL